MESFFRNVMQYFFRRKFYSDIFYKFYNFISTASSKINYYIMSLKKLLPRPQGRIIALYDNMTTADIMKLIVDV